jgi:hypothetical protein
MRRKAIGATAALAVVPLLVAPVGHAEVGVPKLDGPCSAEQSGAMTALPDGATFLSCLGGAGAGYRWRAVESPFAPSTRWLSYGRALKLHGEGLRNPQIQAGDWIGVPQDPDSRCKAEQEAVVSAGEVGPAQVASGESGQPLSLTVVHSLFSIELTGNCLWTKQAG